MHLIILMWQAWREHRAAARRLSEMTDINQQWNGLH